MTRSYKMLLVRAMQRSESFPGSVGLDSLTTAFADLAMRNPNLRHDVSVDLNDRAEVRKLLLKHPIDAWIEARGAGTRPFFALEDGRFRTTFQTLDAHVPVLNDLVEELIDWRLAAYFDKRGTEALQGVAEGPATLFEGAPLIASGGPELWREYMREEIPPLFGLTYNSGSWDQGFVVKDKTAFLLVTLKKTNLNAEHRYEDRFVDALRMHWQSQNRTTQASKHGRIISGEEPGYRLHLFVRMEKLRGKTASPFTYCGTVGFESWKGEKPISVTWRLNEAVPYRLRRAFGVSDAHDTLL